MNLSKQLVVFLSVLGIVFWKPEDSGMASIWIERWAILAGMVLSVGILSSPMKFYTHKFFLLYLSLVSLWGAFYSGFYQEPAEILPLLRSASTQHVLLSFCFLLFLRERIKVNTALGWAGFTLFFAILVSVHPTQEVFLIHNPSMAATFVVLASGIGLWSIAAALLTHSWTAGIVFICGLLWRFRDHVLRAWVFVLACMIAFLCTIGHIPDNGRFAMWKCLVSWWNELPGIQKLFGVGAGSIRVFLPMQEFQMGTAEVHVWAHNDWLQFLLEYGVIGWMLGLASALLALKHMKKDGPVFVGLCAAMCTNMPLHWALTALVGWALVEKNLLTDAIVEENEESASG